LRLESQGGGAAQAGRGVNITGSHRGQRRAIQTIETSEGDGRPHRDDNPMIRNEAVTGTDDGAVGDRAVADRRGMCAVVVAAPQPSAPT